jgi:hypothetical protein
MKTKTKAKSNKVISKPVKQETDNNVSNDKIEETKQVVESPLETLKQLILSDDNLCGQYFRLKTFSTLTEEEILNFIKRNFMK